MRRVQILQLFRDLGRVVVDTALVAGQAIGRVDDDRLEDIAVQLSCALSHLADVQTELRTVIQVEPDKGRVRVVKGPLNGNRH